MPNMGEKKTSQLTIISMGDGNVTVVTPKGEELTALRGHIHFNNQTGYEECYVELNFPNPKLHMVANTE